MLDLRSIPYSHPDAVKLDGEIQEYYARVYGGEDSTTMDAREFAAPLGHFLVGYEAGEPVACGGWRRRDGGDPALLPGDAELKRMYVVQGRRGLGYARAVLAELERTAAAAGRKRLVLETGIRQPEAIALYTRAGYTPMPPFGDYRNSPASRCYAKPLDPPSA